MQWHRVLTRIVSCISEVKVIVIFIYILLWNSGRLHVWCPEDAIVMKWILLFSGCDTGLDWLKWCFFMSRSRMLCCLRMHFLNDFHVVSVLLIREALEQLGPLLRVDWLPLISTEVHFCGYCCGLFDLGHRSPPSLFLLRLWPFNHHLRHYWCMPVVWPNVVDKFLVDELLMMDGSLSHSLLSDGQERVSFHLGWLLIVFWILRIHRGLSLQGHVLLAHITFPTKCTTV